MGVGTTTSRVWRVVETLRRVDAVDRRGPRLNALPTITADAVSQAVDTAGPLNGLIVTVKDSFAMRGLPLSAGSPALGRIRATRDATLVTRLRAAGAILLGKTSMPPVAIGGGQPGVHGFTISPFNPRFLGAAWHSGSSIGSAVAVASGLCDAGLGEETVSSGRSPASNNGIVAYTPSWGVLPSRGNLPLHPYRDVPVLHTPDVSGLRNLLRALVGPDEEDVWHRQSAVRMDGACRLAERLGVGGADRHEGTLRLGVPRRFVGEPTAGHPAVPIRRSIRSLWERTEKVLCDAGIELVRVDFPVVDDYEAPELGGRRFHPEAPGIQGWTDFELDGLMTYAWSQFLRDFGDGTQLYDLSAPAIRPSAPYATDLTYHGDYHPGRDTFDYRRILMQQPPSDAEVRDRAENAVRLFDDVRRSDFESWMDALGLHALAFPANANVGPADAGVNQSAARIAWRDGSAFSNGNHVLRRLGIPTVTVPMGLLGDVCMPVGLTLCGRAWEDDFLISIADRLEAQLPDRPVPPLPVEPASLHSHRPLSNTSAAPNVESPPVYARAVADASGSRVRIELRVETARAVRIELLGRCYELAPGSPFVTTVSRDEWDEVGCPLAIVTAEDDTGLLAAFGTLVLEHDDDAILVESPSE